MVENKRKKIIIIDDLSSAHKMYKKIFKGKTDIVSLMDAEFRNIQKKIKVTHPDLIILDLFFGANKDEGFRLLRKLKKDPELYKIPIIVCSKYCGFQTKEEITLKKKALAYGANDAIPKYPEPKAIDFLKYIEEKI